MFKLPTEKYSSVPGTEDIEEFFFTTETFQLPVIHPPRRPSPYIITALLVISLSIFCSLGFCIGRKFPANLDQTCVRHTSKYCRYPSFILKFSRSDFAPSVAPLLDNIEVSYHVEKFDGKFVKENIYRQVGSPQVDAAWEALGVGCKCTKIQSFNDPYLSPLIQIGLFCSRNPKLQRLVSLRTTLMHERNMVVVILLSRGVVKRRMVHMSQ
jgi:hypothetical protein